MYSDIDLQPLPLRRSKAGMFNEKETIYHKNCNRNIKTTLRYSKSSENIKMDKIKIPKNKGKNSTYSKQHSV